MDEIQKTTIYAFVKLIEILLEGDIKPTAYSLIFARVFHLSATIANLENPGGVETLHKSKFYPEPATDAIVVELIPTKPKTHFLQFCRSLFENQNKLVEHVLRLYESHCDGRRPQKSKVNLPIDILNKRADHLSNSDFEKLFLCFA